MKDRQMPGRARHDRWAVLAFLLAACAPEAPTTLDGSSPQAFAQSAERARGDLPVADRLDFDRALASVPARRYANDDPDALRLLTYNGMTAAEVVEDYRDRQR